VDEQDRPGALEAPRRPAQPEDGLDRTRHEPGLAVQEEEGQHAHEGRQHGGERDQ